MIQTTTAYHKINRLTKKIKVIQGGQGAGKTVGICQKMLYKSFVNSNNLATIVTDTYMRLEDGVMTDYRNLFQSMGLNFNEYYHSQKKNLILPNNAIIQFRNVDKYSFESGKGPRRNDLFVNEATRTRWPEIEHAWNRTTDNIYVDFNPDREFWYHENVKNGEFDKNDIDFIILTYKDNELLSEGELKVIMLKKARAEAIKEKVSHGIEITQSERSALLWWQIYGEGKLGTYSDRQIYAYEFCDEIPPTARRIPSGMDFGQSPDPTILVDLYVEGANLYCDERFCENNLMPEKIQGAERMSVVDKMDEIGFPKGQMIIGDSAARDTILDMRKYKYNIIAVKKNIPVIDGISKVNSYNIHITKRSVNIKKGIESWFRKIDANGKIIPEPDGHEPDGLAAIRYGIMGLRQRSKVY